MKRLFALVIVPGVAAAIGLAPAARAADPFVPGLLPQAAPPGIHHGDPGYGWDQSQATYLMEVRPNWSWYFPYGGHTVYPGQPGSCCKAVSDYSRLDWVVGPNATARAVTQKLNELGIPPVDPPTTFLNRNPNAVPEKPGVPVPSAWIKERERLKAELEAKLREQREREAKEKAEKERKEKEEREKKEKKDKEDKEKDPDAVEGKKEEKKEKKPGDF